MTVFLLHELGGLVVMIDRTDKKVKHLGALSRVI